MNKSRPVKGSANSKLMILVAAIVIGLAFFLAISLFSQSKQETEQIRPVSTSKFCMKFEGTDIAGCQSALHFAQRHYEGTIESINKTLDETFIVTIRTEQGMINIIPGGAQ